MAAGAEVRINGRLVLSYLVDYMYINLTNAEKHAIACLYFAEEPTRATSKIIKCMKWVGVKPRTCEGFKELTLIGDRS